MFLYVYTKREEKKKLDRKNKSRVGDTICGVVCTNAEDGLFMDDVFLERQPLHVAEDGSQIWRSFLGYINPKVRRDMFQKGKTYRKTFPINHWYRNGVMEETKTKCAIRVNFPTKNDNW